MVRSRRWRRLLNLIDRLPVDSHYAAALAQDDELLELAMAEHPGPMPTRSPSTTEFTPVVELLAAVYDAIRVQTATLLAVNGNKPEQPKPWPRPETARDRQRKRQFKQGALDIIAQATPAHVHRYT